MQRHLIIGLACLFVLGGAVSAKPAPGRFVAPPIQPIPQRVLQADTIVVGKVTTVAEKLVKAARFKGDMQMGEYRLFTVKIDSAVQGANGLTHIKVGCLLPLPVAPVAIDPSTGGPGIRPNFRPFIQPPPMLGKDQEALLFLRPHASEPFYTLSAMGDVTDSKAGNFKADVELAKKVAKLLAEPMTGLKAKDANDRYLAAALLVTKYRTPAGPSKEVDVPAEESKLILEGLAAGDWNAQLARPGYDPFTPMNMFSMLQPQTAGWVQPQNFQEVPAAMKKWLEANAGKFRIKRFVAAKSE